MRNIKRGGQGGFSLQPWLPFAASTVIMAMVVLMAAENVKHLNKATQWRRRSADVIVSGQSFENNLLEIQRGMRGYVTLGDTNALNLFYRNVAVEPAQLRELQTFTASNIAQQKRLKALGTAVTALIAFDNRAIGAYRREGFAGIVRLDETGEERRASGRARHISEQFCADEQRLWAERDAAEENQYHTTGELLIGGCAVAAILLLLAHSLAGSELRRRRRAEEKLKRTLLMQNAILDSADYGIVATDRDGIVQTFNRAAERLLGYSAEEVIGKVTPMLWRDPEEVRRQAEIFSERTAQPVPCTFEAILKKVELESVDEGEWTFIRKDGSRFPCLLVITGLGKGAGPLNGLIGIFRDISDRRKHEQEREELIAQLKTALAEVKTLSGMIPICAWCKSVRSDTGYWESVEQYVHSHSEASFSHGVCPSCAARFKDEIVRANQKSEALSKA